jgi:heat-inducible transcriptional repressor
MAHPLHQGLARRKDQVLSAVIDDYIQTAEPVASRTLARRYGFGLSAATLRNELADLEELGFLDKPHTSAGRVPSDKGYRYYVDRLLVKPALSPADVAHIHQALGARVREIEWFLHQTAKLVSDATHYPALVLTVKAPTARVARLSFTPLSRDAGILVVTTDTGRVENRVVLVPDDVEAAQLAALADELSAELAGVPLGELADRLARHLDREARALEELVVWLQADDRLDGGASAVGVVKLAQYPEFRDVNRLRAVWELLEQPPVVERLFGETPAGGVTVRIGAELPVAELADLSVVVASCEVGRQVMGQVAVVGPRRMEYGRVVAILEQVVGELSHVLNWL